MSCLWMELFSPKAFQIDFEMAVINAIAILFPYAQIRGCFFHFSQCFWRKIQELGLATNYKTDGSALRSYAKVIQSLALCPLDQIDEAWEIIASFEPEGERVQEFTAYFMRTWLLSNAKFRREFWNHFDNDGMRTTNNLEGYHHALNKLVGAAHPNILKFIEIIKNEQQIFRKVLANIAGRAKPPNSREKYRLLHEAVERTKTLMRRGDISLSDYIEQIKRKNS
ncbi:unnamed protein product [Blepharisma stoltei]|uniref:MULE transposase domain-containing protein n=1 Tax=Blepharisma stoltei TaxID=1481888 RepID=A0AAU9IJD7_9CILI|nr:unnamed protein product [Blepharisma stoltei]